jgi:hypothetical protein
VFVYLVMALQHGSRDATDVLKPMAVGARLWVGDVSIDASEQEKTACSTQDHLECCGC